MKGSGGGRKVLEPGKSKEKCKELSGLVPVKGGGIGDGGSDCLAMVRQLLELGADPLFETHIGKTAILTAVEYCRMDVVKLLFERATKCNGESVDAILNATNTDGISVLLQAVMSRHREMAQYFIQLGADQFQRDIEGRDAMAWAKLKGFGDVVRILEAFVSYPAMVRTWNDEEAMLKTKLMDRALMDNNFPVV